jgi:anti-anti-sigma regulatory factor
MILAPVPPVAERTLPTPVTIRLIGILDRALLESFADAFSGLTAPGQRTLIVLVRDLSVMNDDSLDRFLATLERFRAAGNTICIDTTPAWRKIMRGRAKQFEASTPMQGRSARRQLIICHSVDKRTGAA